MNEKYNNLIKQRDKAEKKIEQADFKARQSKYYERSFSSLQCSVNSCNLPFL